MFKVQQQNRLKQKGLLQRFNIDCYGTQKTVSDLRSDKSKKYNELKNKRGTAEWENYFLRYNPYHEKNKNTRKKKKKPKRKNTRRKRKNIFGL